MLYTLQSAVTVAEGYKVPSTLSLPYARAQNTMLQAPDDLLCPILHTVMRNPVITEAGTMYEESAIRNHLARFSNKDPLSNQPISDDLRPVYVVRSKAKEYATNTARVCIERGKVTDHPAAFATTAHPLSAQAVRFFFAMMNF